MTSTPRPATVADVHDIAGGMPHVTVDEEGPKMVYQVGGKSFVFFRTPRRDAVDEVTGERLTDVIVIWVGSDGEKQALLQDERLPFFTTPHFDGHPSVLVREAHLSRISVDELREIIQDAWLSRASATRAKAWLATHSA
ncbi:hypothetical protein N864_14210 [Intrasporangium chromatireducens Q5-1]|uniref:MmcQ-like protein n=1 Tax=Intrasporangium chromatireducens Q5-1 TaxID=584657 RepID=W9GDR2_9MICO|nr:MmcQ/YjbR family DNA-binding protein [Intrasporangium chromatireducens]EWT04351.1 hypothetical protein N864_14210 [Intrasporangium chromatireducens Q5-1]